MSLIDFGLTVVLPALSGAGAGWVLLHFFGQRFVDHRLKKLFEGEMKPKAMELAGIFRAQLGVERKDKKGLPP